MAIFENIIDDDFSEIIKDKYTKILWQCQKWFLPGCFVVNLQNNDSENFKSRKREKRHINDKGMKNSLRVDFSIV